VAARRWNQAEPYAEASHVAVDRNHHVIAGKEQHSVDAPLAERRQRGERAPRLTDGRADGRGQPRMAAEEINARAKHAQALLLIAAAQGYRRLELLSRRVPHGIRGQRRNPLERAERRVTPRGRGLRGQRVPHEQAEQLAWWRRERPVESLERHDDAEQRARSSR
jgi:hypothetical protein